MASDRLVICGMCSIDEHRRAAELAQHRIAVLLRPDVEQMNRETTCGKIEMIGA